MLPVIQKNIYNNFEINYEFTKKTAQVSQSNTTSIMSKLPPSTPVINVFNNNVNNRVLTTNGDGQFFTAEAGLMVDGDSNVIISNKKGA